MLISATMGACTAVTAGLVYGAVAPNSNLFGPVIGRGPREKSVYLTFDDGPSLEWTPRILDILSVCDVPAAFFLVGRYCDSNRSVAREVARAGYAVGNHTWSHRKLHLRSRSWISDELNRTHDIIADACDTTPRCFRAPHGYRNPFVSHATRALGYTTFGWTFGVWDTALPGAEVIRRRMRSQLSPGAILLLHDGDGYDSRGDRSQTVAALPGIIQDARDLGYTFRSICELIPA